MDTSHLFSLTNTFFDDFWKEEFGKQPSWSADWKFHASLPNYDQKGCYALLCETEVYYIGLALSKENVQGDNGIGHRVSNYWELNKSEEVPTTTRYKPKERFKAISSIITIGFPEEYAYLAAALEIFLIWNMKPKMNVIHT